MKSRFTLFFGLTFFVFISNSAGQQKPEPLKEAIQNTGKAFSDLFHKKKKGADSSSANTTDNNTKKSTTSASTAVTKKNKPVGEIGKLAPNVKYIDADALQPFNHGAAVIRKGSSTALIGPDGNFIVPYNTYKFMLDDKPGLSSKPMYVESGIFQTYNSSDGNTYFINSKGKLIAPLAKGENYTFTQDKRMVGYHFSNPGGADGTTYITADGINILSTGTGIVILMKA